MDKLMSSRNSRKRTTVSRR